MVIDPLTAVLNWAEPENSRGKGEKKTAINSIISKINEIITQLGAQNELGELTDVTISGTPADNELLAYDSGSSEWINQTASEVNLVNKGTPFNISETVETDGSGDLITASKNTAYNKSFGASTGNVPDIASSLAVSSIVETDGSSDLITASKNTGYNKVLSAFPAPRRDLLRSRFCAGIRT